MRKKMKFEWELLNGSGEDNSGISTTRARVIGGWVVKDLNWTPSSTSSSMVFIPDRDHEWEIEPSQIG